MKKRLLTLALVLAMCLSLAIPAFAAASGDPKPEDTAPVVTESAKPEESKAPDASESAKPEDKDPEPSDSAKPEDKDPEASDSANPEDKDPEPSESVKPAAPAFTDVPEGVYYAEPVAWAVEKKITNGTEPTKFEPATTCSQIQILTFLYRAVQSAEDPDFAPDATDLTKAAEWAKEKGMIDDTFDGSKPCTRATSVNYIWQAFGKPKAEKKSEFTDVKADADYADAVDWAVEKEITDGYGSLTIFAPDRICDRGQIVTLLNRAYTKTEAPETPAEPTPSEPVESAPVESAPVESTAPQESAKPAT